MGLRQIYVKHFRAELFFREYSSSFFHVAHLSNILWGLFFSHSVHVAQNRECAEKDWLFKMGKPHIQVPLELTGRDTTLSLSHARRKVVRLIPA